MTNGTACAKEPIPTARLRLKNGWRATVVLRDAAGNRLSRSDWRELFEKPEQIVAGEGKTLKSDGLNSVVVRTIRLGQSDVCAVVKCRHEAAGLSDAFRRLGPARSFRTLRTALALQRMGIASEYPLAAAEHRQGLWSTCSVYISGYVEQSRNLYYFLRDDLETFGRREPACRRAVAEQIAGILAGLHKGGLWHRDAKAGNFLVQRAEAGPCALTLVDVDGIKPYRFGRRRNRFRSLVKLAATVLCHRSVHRSDYWRAFSIYCDLTSLEHGRRQLFGRLVERAVAVRLLTMATSAMQGRGVVVDAND